MRKKCMTLWVIFGFVYSHQLIGWNPFKASDWKDTATNIGSGIQSAGKKIENVGQTAGEGFSYVGKEVEKNVIDKIVGGWEIKRNIGKQLDAGADQLEASPDKLEKDAIQGLQTGLVQGINKNLMPVLIAKTSEISAKREEIAQNKKTIEDNKEMASELGKASLVKDLLDGFDAADQALAMLWAGQSLEQKASTPKSAIGSLRQKLTTTIEASGNQDFSTVINANKNDSIIWDLFNAAQTAINNTQTGINQIKSEIDELKNKIYPSGKTSLPTRMRDLAKILKV